MTDNNTVKTDKAEERRIVEEYLLSYMRAGKLEGGAKLPSSNELAAHLSINRNVVRSVIGKLSLQGKIYTIKGKGSFVAGSPTGIIFKHQNDLGFSEIIKGTGEDYDSKLISCKLVSAAKLRKNVFRLNEPEQIYHITLLRTLGGSPLAICHSFIPRIIAPGIDEYLTDYSSVNEILQTRYGLEHPHCEKISIAAVMPRNSEMKLLEIGDYVPLLHMVNINYVHGIGAVEYYDIKARGDRFQLSMSF